MIARYSSSLASASLITLGLLYLMAQMIATGRPALGTGTVARLIPWITVERPPPEVVRDDRPTRPDDPELRPPRTTTERTFGHTFGVPVVGPTAPGIERQDPARSTFVDGDVLPIVKVQPNYPIRALQLGLEGQVLVEFTVTRTGSVADVVVIESTHRIFERSAIEAASKFRYRPRIIDGDPVDVRGIRNLITFDLDD